VEVKGEECCCQTSAEKFVLLVLNVASLLVVVISTVASSLLHARSALQLDVMGTCPRACSLRCFPHAATAPALPSALILGLISFTTNWAVAVQFAEAKGYEVDANAELVAAGLSNLVHCDGWAGPQRCECRERGRDSSRESHICNDGDCGLGVSHLVGLLLALAAIIMTSVFSIAGRPGGGGDAGGASELAEAISPEQQQQRARCLR
jgi:hypothetical protein